MTFNIVFSVSNIELAVNVASIIAGISSFIALVITLFSFYFRKKRFKEYINIKIKKHQDHIDQLTESISSEIEVQKKESKSIDILLNTQKERTKDKLRELKSFLIHEIEDKNNVGRNKKLTQEIEKRITKIDDLIQKLNNKRELIDNWNEIHKQLKQIANSF